MLTKETVASHFSKAASTYDTQATVQLEMASLLLKKLLSYQKDNTAFNQILEIGCGTGQLSSMLMESLDFKKLVLNDFSEDMLLSCQKKFDGTNKSNLIDYMHADAEKLKKVVSLLYQSDLDNKDDLIISNACFQWFKDLKKALNNFKSLLTADGIIAFTTFGEGNFKELKQSSSFGLDYLSRLQIETILQELDLEYSFEEKVTTSYFADIKAMLKSFKQTGVSGLSHQIWTKQKLFDFTKAYEELRQAKGLPLTWVSYFVIAKPKA